MKRILLTLAVVAVMTLGGAAVASAQHRHGGGHGHGHGGGHYSGGHHGHHHHHHHGHVHVPYPVYRPVYVQPVYPSYGYGNAYPGGYGGYGGYYRSQNVIGVSGRGFSVRLGF